MKKTGKVINLILVLTIVFLLIGMNLAVATENNGENQSENQTQPITGLEHSIEKYYQISDSEEENVEENSEETESNNTVLLQERIEVYRNDNIPKIENENLGVILPVLQEKAPDSAVVLVNGVKLGENSYSYDAQNGILRITLDEESELNNIGNSTDVYQIIYKYSGIEFEENTNVNLNTTVYTKCENIDEVTLQKEDNVEISQLGSSLSLSGQITGQISKGYLYQGNQRDTDYVEKYQISSSSLEDIGEVTISLESENYVQENGEERNLYNVNGNTYFKGIYLSKENLLTILGQDGSLTVNDPDGNVLYTINKDTETDENGNIRIDYENTALNRIQIKTTKPVQEGKLDIYSIKTMKPNTGYTKEELESFNKYEETIKANDVTTVLTMNLADTTPNADLQLNKTELSTMQENQEMEVKVILKGTDASMELYNNPLLQITFPDEVEQISLQSDMSLLYEQELQIANSWVDGKTVYIELQGEQTSYKEEAIQGAEINFKVNLTLNKRATNSDKEIKLNVINQGNGKTAEVSKQVKIVSPRDMITINSINDVGIETYGQEENSQVTLNRDNDKKEVQVSSEIINNNTNAQDIRVLGDMPTNDSENNLNATVVSPISVEGVQAKVYYTENENADENLENSQNGWTESFESVNEPKKYLLVADQMNVADTLKTSYTVQIPESLQYDQKATEGYTVMFADAESTSNNVKATDVTLTTGQGPTLEGNLTASVGNDTINSGDTVKVGEVIYYNLSLKNTGSEAATNVAVNVPVPEGMKLLEIKPAFISGEDAFENMDDRGYIYGNGFYNELEDKSYNTTVETIEIGETVNVQFLLRANSVNVENSNMNVTPQVSYNGDNLEVNSLDVNIDDNVFQVYLKSVDDLSYVHREGLVARYLIGIKNTSDTTQTNVQVNTIKPENMTLSTVLIGENNVEANEPIVIDSIDPGEEKLIRLTYDIGEIEQEEEELLVSAQITSQGGEVTRTNTFGIMAYGVSLDVSLTSSNENGYVKTDDEIQYVLTITNDGASDVSGIFITDEISSELTILSVTQNGEEVEVNGNSVIISAGDLAVGESIEIVINTIVNYSDTRTEDTDITNQAVVEINGRQYTSNEVMHTIEASKTEEPEDPDNPDPDNPDPDNPNPDNPNPGEETETYSIRGTAWLDENSDGEMQDSEEKIQNVNVMALNVETNELATDTDGNIIRATTDSSGVYTLNNLAQGRYIVVFEYDQNRYSLTTYQKEGVSETRNSDVVSRDLTINGNQGTYAVTDTIEITDGSIANISIGLVRAREFDLQLNKYVTRIVLQSPSGTKVHSFDNTSLARVDLEAKEMNNTSVVIEYSIVITNVGEVDAYARDIADRLPEGFEFSSELNKDWYLIGNEAHNVSIANDVIRPNESRTLTLVLTKDMTSDTSGTYTNTAEIADSYNDSGIQDLNNSNNSSQAQAILGIRTGTIILNIALIVTCVVTIGVGIYFIKKKVLN